MLERCEDRRRRQNSPRLVIDLSAQQSIERARVSISSGEGWQQIGEQQSYDNLLFWDRMVLGKLATEKDAYRSCLLDRIERHSVTLTLALYAIAIPLLPPRL